MTIQNTIKDINSLTEDIISKMSNAELGEIHDLDHDCGESCMICAEMAGRGLLRSGALYEPDDEDIAYAEECEKAKEQAFNSSRGV